VRWKLHGTAWKRSLGVADDTRMVQY